MPKVIQTFLIILFLSLTSCSPSFETRSTWELPADWSYTNLRAIDPSDTDRPAQDILATYVRFHRGKAKVQIRIDFLDLTTRSDLDLYIAIDHAPGGSNSLPINTTPDISWDTLLIIPESGDIQALDSDGNPRPGLALQVIRDTVLDTITIEMNASVIQRQSPLGFRAQLFTTSPESLDLTDLTEPFHSSSEPPERAQLLLAFWNTFPAYTPAQSLRRWDGAHTGPYGGRHGLYNLLRASRNRSIPIVLLDLKYPPALSALDYAGGLNMVKDLSRRGLLILPEVVPFASTEKQIDLRQSTLDFNLPTSPFLYPLSSAGEPISYPVIFSRAPELSDPIVYLYRTGQRKVIPLPQQSTEQATVEGPTLNVRRTLVETAIISSEIPPGEGQPLLLLGGDLPNSTWGDPASARATMKYIAKHPWIQLMKSSDLLSASTLTYPFDERFQPASTITTQPPLPPSLPESPIADDAWHTYLSLFAPLTNMPYQLSDLRAHYTWQVDALIAAAQWDADPKPIAICENNSGSDGSSPCILASKNIYAHFDPHDGSLVFAFARLPLDRPGSGAHQFIGPSSQFIIGTSDPSTWDLSLGQRADPAVIPGAFADNLGPYQATISDHHIEFRSPSALKIYQLTETGLHFEFQGPASTQFQIPLVLDPWLRFIPGWGENYDGDLVGEIITGDYTWGIVHNEFCSCQQHDAAANQGTQFAQSRMGSTSSTRYSICPCPKILIRSSAEITPSEFIATRDIMGQRENPNTEYPTGHYLPFPLSLIQVSNTTNLKLDISLLH
jgi:hypothetical protein